MSVTQYIGARYVPMFAEPIDWDITKSYSPLTIVYHQGNSYTSKQSVPSGTDINNETYWALTGNYNAQIEQYRAEVVAAKTEADTATTVNTSQDAQLAGTTASGLKSLISAEGNKNDEQDNQLDGTVDSGLKTLITDETTARTTKDTSLDSQLAGTSTSGLKTLITAETTARQSGDSTNAAAIASNVSAIADETTARKTADTAESTARQSGDSTNAAAIATETTAREAADTAFKSQIENEFNGLFKKRYKNVLMIGDSFLTQAVSWGDELTTQINNLYSSNSAPSINSYKYPYGATGFVRTADGKNFQTLLAQAFTEHPTITFDLIVIGGGINENPIETGLATAINNMLSTISINNHGVQPDVFIFHNLWGVKGYNQNYENLTKILQDNSSYFNVVRGCWTWLYDYTLSAGFTNSDGVHPSAAGAKKIGDNMFSTIFYGCDRTVKHAVLDSSLVSGSGCTVVGYREYMNLFITINDFDSATDHIWIKNNYAPINNVCVGCNADGSEFALHSNQGEELILLASSKPAASGFCTFASILNSSL